MRLQCKHSGVLYHGLCLSTSKIILIICVIFFLITWNTLKTISNFKWSSSETTYNPYNWRYINNGDMPTALKEIFLPIIRYIITYNKYKLRLRIGKHTYVYGTINCIDGVVTIARLQ